jgi:hypothetical protein
MADPADPMNTLLNPYLTYHFDKVSCMRGAYFAHVTFAYLMFLAGIAAFVTRLVPALKWTHAWFGRAYIIFMLWATATSLIIHNSGLPAATLISFVWSLGGLTISWVIIKFHERSMHRQALANVQKNVAVNGLQGSLEQMIAAEMDRLAASKTFLQRFFSLKALHGILMFVSWINIAGRIFATRLSGDFTCHTYPVYKPLDTLDNDQLILIPTHDPNYSRLPWAKLGLAKWGVVMLLAPLFGAALVGAAYSLVAARVASRRSKPSQQVDTVPGQAKAVDLGP